MSRLICRILFFAILISAQTAHGNSSVKVSSQFLSQDIYKVVFTSDESDTKEAPGIYALVPGEKQPKLVVSGKVLDVSESFNGVLEQLKMTKATRRNEALAVVDGLLTLFSNRSTPGSDKNKIQFGDAQTPVLDGQTLRPMRIAPIKSIKDVHVVLFDKAKTTGDEILLVSLNQPNDFGSGVTFAVLVRRPVKVDQSKIELASSPLIIDYDFLDQVTMERLRSGCEGTDTILSRSHLLSMGQSMPNDDKILRQWRGFVQKLANEIKAGTRDKLSAVEAVARGAFRPPKLDLGTGRTLLESLPFQTVTEHPYAIVQRADPLGGRSGVFVLDNGLEADANYSQPSAKPTVSGAIDFNQKTGHYSVTALNQGDLVDLERTVQLIRIDHRPYLLLGASNPRIPLLVDANAAPFLQDERCKFSGFHKIAKQFGYVNSPDHVVLLSMDCGQTKGTYSLMIQETSSRSAQIVSTTKISNKVYGAAELSERFFVYKLAESEGYAFDNVRDRSEYKALRAKAIADSSFQSAPTAVDLTPSVPLLDLSGDGVIYLRPEESKALTGDLAYRIYSHEDSGAAWTGLYVNNRWNAKPRTSLKDPTVFSAIPGYMLRPYNAKGAMEKEFAQFSKKFEIAENSFILTVVPQGLQPQVKGTPYGKFRIALHAQTLNSILPALPELSSIDVNEKFSSLEGIKILNGIRNSSDEIVCLLFFIDAKQNQSVLSVSFRLKVEADGRMSQVRLLQTSNPTWIYSNGESVLGTLKRHVVYDSNGSLYWINDPSLDRFDGKYSVRSLSKNPDTVLYPNRAGTNLPIRYNESLIEDESGFFGHRRSYWKVDFIDEIAKRFNGLPEFLASQREDSKSQKKNKKSIHSLFPGFEAFLNEEGHPDEPIRHQILLVEPELKDAFIRQMIANLDEKNSDSNWRIKNEKLSFHVFDLSEGPEGTRKNLELIGTHSPGKPYLFADLGQILETEKKNPPLTFIAPDVAKNNLIMPAKGGDSNVNELSPDKAQNSARDANGNSDDGDEDDEYAQEDEEDPAEDFFLENEQPGDSQNVFEFAPHIAEKRDDTRFDFSRLAYLSAEGLAVVPERIGSAEWKRRKKHIAMTIVATPQEWRAYRQRFPRETRSGFFDDFKINSRFLTGGWTVWPPHSAKASEKTREASKSPISKDEYQIFASLDAILNEAANKSKPAEQRIVVVPEELKAYINNLITIRWSTSQKDMEGAWNYRNENLALFQVNSASELSQEAIIDNFASIRGANHSRRAVVIADMAEILRIGRPEAKNPDETFKLKDPILSSKSEQTLIEGQSKSVLENRQTPHMLWWLATEGHKVQPKREKGWSLRQDVKSEAPLIILSTEQELLNLQQQTAFESRFLNVEKHFEITRLASPTADSKARLLSELFTRDEIAALKYDFVHESLSSDEAKRQLISLFVGRVDQIARSLKMEPTSAFIRAFVALKRALLEDPTLRSSRQIDRFYLERLYAKVFPLPLNFEILAEKDWLHKFKNPEKAARALTDSGYDGALELKARVARGITAQTKGLADNGRRIPSSMIIFGDTSTGKTFLVETIVKMSGMKIYDYDKPNDEDAEAMIIKVQDIVESEDGNKPGSLSIEKLMGHISNFLALPKGHRGLLLFDDMHKAQPEVWKKLKSLLESLFEAKDGLYKVKRLGTDVYLEIPVRNLVLFMTLNPQDNVTIRNSYVKDLGNGKKDTVGEAMAALNKDGYDSVDRSFFARWADIIDLSEFPRDAKVPALLKKVREANAQQYAAVPNLTLVTPRTMDELIQGFEDANAREFLGPATNALLEAPSALPKAPIYIIDRQRHMDRNTDKSMGQFEKIKVEDVERFIGERTSQLAVFPKKAFTKLPLLSFMLDSFRSQVYGGLVLASQANSDLHSEQDKVTSELTTFLLALLSNIKEFPSVPLDQVDFRPTDFGITDIEEIRAFQDTTDKYSVQTATPFFRIPIRDSSSTEDISLESFLGGHSSTPPNRTRMNVLIETSQRIEDALAPLLAQYFRVSKFSELHSPREWILGLNGDEPKELFKTVAVELVNEYWRFSAKLYDLDLEEMRNSKSFAQMSSYDHARLYLLSLDRALTRLPWGRLTEFLVQVMDLAGQDLSLSQRTPFQDFLFRSQYSPVNTVTPDSVLALIRSTTAFKNMPENRESFYEERFSKNCQDFLITKDQQ